MASPPGLMRRCTVAPQDPSSQRNREPARRNDPILMAEPQHHPRLAELVGQPPQRHRRVRDPTVLPHLAPLAAFRDRHDDPVLVNVKPDIREMIPKTRLLCMRLGTGQSSAT